MRNAWPVIAVGIVSVVGIGANLLLDYLTGEGQFGPHLGFRFYILRLLALCATAIPGLLAILRAESRASARKRREQLDDLSRVLEASVRRLFPDENPYLVRANVMVVEGDELKVLCGWNMDSYPDSRMNLSFEQGVAGKVWKRATENPLNECWQPVYAPKAQLGKQSLKTKWRLTDDDIGRTSHIMWILSTPLLHREGDRLKFLGVLNFDGVTKLLVDMKIFEDDQFHLRCVAIADHVSSLIAQGDLFTK